MSAAQPIDNWRESFGRKLFLFEIDCNCVDVHGFGYIIPICIMYVHTFSKVVMDQHIQAADA